MARQKKELDRFDTNAKRNFPILGKLILITAISITFCAVTNAVLSLNVFDKRFEESTKEELDYTAKGIRFLLEDSIDYLLDRYRSLQLNGRFALRFYQQVGSVL